MHYFLPTALSACRTSIPNVWLHHQVSSLFAERKIIICCSRLYTQQNPNLLLESMRDLSQTASKPPTQKNPFDTYWVSRGELAALHQAVKGGFEDGVFCRDFFLLHPLCRQLLEKLSSNKDTDAKGLKSASAEREIP